MHDVTCQLSEHRRELVQLLLSDNGAHNLICEQNAPETNNNEVESKKKKTTCRMQMQMKQRKRKAKPKPTTKTLKPKLRNMMKNIITWEMVRKKVNKEMMKKKKQKPN